MRRLLNAVRANPGSDRVVRDWAANLLPHQRDSFATAWRDAFAAAWDTAPRDRDDGPQNRDGATRRGPGGRRPGEAGEAEKEAERAEREAEARAIADRLESRPLTRLYKHTDVGNGERLAAKFGAGLRYCHPWKKWLYWDGRRWDLDRLGVLPQCAKRTARAICTEEMGLIDEDDGDGRASLEAWARKSEDYKRVSAMIKLAESEPHIPILPEDVDVDPWLLNCQNCTLDLRVNAPNGTDRTARLT